MDRSASTITATRFSTLLEIRNLSCSIGGRTILRDISLDVGEGETLVLLGRSGSGKTTLLKTVNGLIQPSAGAIRFAGRATAEWDPIQMRRRMGYVIQDAGLFPHWTVGGQRRAGAAAGRLGAGAHRAARGRTADGGGTGARRVPRTLSARTLGRAEAAGGNRARAGGGSAAAAFRRTVRGAGPDHAAGIAAAVSRIAAQRAQDGALRDARYPRGHDAGVADRAIEGRRAGCGGGAARVPRRARRPKRGRSSPDWKQETG